MLPYIKMIGMEKRDTWLQIYLQIASVEELSESEEEMLILQTQTGESIGAGLSGLCPALQHVTGVVGKCIFPPFDGTRHVVPPAFSLCAKLCNVLNLLET